MIKDLRTANLNKDKELKTIFPKSFDFICNTMGYKIEDFKTEDSKEVKFIVEI